MSRREQLAQRRALLVTECALQRITLSGQSQSLAQMKHWSHIGHRLINQFKNLPGWVSVLGIGLLLVSPGRALGLVKKGLLLFQLWRAVSSNWRSSS